MSRYQRIQQLLSTQLTPSILLIEDESYKHSRPGVETHFKVIVVSTQFNLLSRIQRHRLVQKILANEFESGLHALSLFLYTSEEWQQKETIPTTPDCQHTQSK